MKSVTVFLQSLIEALYLDCEGQMLVGPREKLKFRRNVVNLKPILSYIW